MPRTAMEEEKKYKGKVLLFLTIFSVQQNVFSYGSNRQFLFQIPQLDFYSLLCSVVYSIMAVIPG